MALTVPRTVIHYRPVRFPYLRCPIPIEKDTLRCPFVLVELRGIEPLSEKTLIGLSPGAADFLILPRNSANRQALLLGSFFLYDRFKS